MDPFDAPPSTSAVSLEPPVDPPAPRRGRTVAIVLGTAGVIGAGIVGVSQFAAADDPELADVPVADRPELDLVAATDDEPAEGEPDEPGDDDTTDGPGGGTADGEIRIQVGDGEPIVIDLGDVIDGELHDCIGLPALGLPGDDGTVPGDARELDPGELDLGELDLGELFDQFLADGALADLLADEELQAWLDELESMEDDRDVSGDVSEWGEWGAWDLGDQVTVTGDDGLTVIDLGDGDAAVTIERDGATGEVTISTDGTATTRDLDQLFGEFHLDEMFGEFDLDEMLGELDLPAPPERTGPIPDWPALDRIEECLGDREP